MWEVTVYKDYGYNVTSFSKTFEEEDDAYDFFEGELREEFEIEIIEGLLTDQEFQDMINKGEYKYTDDKREIYISINERKK